MNIVILKGRLTRDPDFRQTQSGTSMCRLSVAVDGFKDKDGNKQTDFIECTAWRNTADFISRYFTKGQEILLEGNLKNNNYEDANGAKHYSYTVNVNKVHFCGRKADNQGSGQPVQQAQAQERHPAANNVAESLNVQDIAEFEEILSDGEVPF